MQLEVFRVTDDVWCLRRRSYLTCSYVVRTARGNVLVDAGMDSTGGDLVDALERSFGAKPEDVRAILITHWHNDHAAGARVMQERGARVYYHERDRPQLTGATAHVGVRGRLAGAIPELGPLVLFKGLLGEATPRAVEADQLVRDGERIEEDFEVIETPGHTPGHVSFFYAPERMLFAGDALAVIDDEVRFMARPVTPDVPEARRSMEKCLARTIEHVCPGHRLPLSVDTAAKCRRMRERLEAGIVWPLLG